MKIFTKVRKIIMKFFFTIPSSSSSATRRRCKLADSCSDGEAPNISCSNSYYSHSHYSEAISDCIDFFNKSSINNNNNVSPWLWRPDCSWSKLSLRLVKLKRRDVIVFFYFFVFVILDKLGCFLLVLVYQVKHEFYVLNSFIIYLLNMA